MNVNLGSGNCRLSRLDDLRWRRLRRSALAIRTPELVADIWQAVARMRADRPQLASTYTVLRALFGESGRCFDDWKGAFSFPFEIEVSKGSVRFAYLLEVASWRGALEFRFARQLGLAERGFNRSMCYPPFDPEFSAAEMANLVSFLCAFIDGTVDAFQRTRTLEDFALRVPSEKTLFGVRKGVFFLEQYDNEDECCITAGGRAL